MKDTTQQAAAKRLRKQALQTGNKQRVEVEKRHPFKNEPKSGGVGYQPKSYGG